MISPNESTTQGKGNERAKAKNAAPDDPPDHLNDDARLKWRETWPRLDSNCFDASRDRDTLAQYCEAWADIQQAETEIQRVAQIEKTIARTEKPAKCSNSPDSFYEQRAAAMDRFDRAAEKIGLSLSLLECPSWSHYASAFAPFPEELAEQDEKEANSTASGRRHRIWTCKRVWGALQRSLGNMAAAARLLGETYGVNCKCTAISLLVKKHPQLREAAGDYEEALRELCYEALMQSAMAGDGSARRFVLRKFHPAYKDPPPFPPRTKPQ